MQSQRDKSQLGAVVRETPFFLRVKHRHVCLSGCLSKTDLAVPGMPMEKAKNRLLTTTLGHPRLSTPQGPGPGPRFFLCHPLHSPRLTL